MQQYRHSIRLCPILDWPTHQIVFLAKKAPPIAAPTGGKSLLATSATMADAVVGAAACGTTATAVDETVGSIHDQVTRATWEPTCKLRWHLDPFKALTLQAD